MIKHYDAIIELGYKIDNNWNFPPHLEKSIQITADLYRKKAAPLIIVSGKWSIIFDHDKITPSVTESGEMKKALMLLGVPADAILVEEESKDTIGNAYFTKVKIVKPKNLKSLLIVCAQFHIPRVEYIFKKIYGPEYELDFIQVQTPLTQDIIEAQNTIFEKQKVFLSAMKDGDESYLTNKLYGDLFYQRT